MFLRNVYSFLKIYTAKNPEVLLVWLQNHQYYDQLLFLKLLVFSKIDMRTVLSFGGNNLHLNCQCQQTYDSLFKNSHLYAVLPSVSFLGACIPPALTDDVPRPSIDITTMNQTQFLKKKRVLAFTPRVSHRATRPQETPSGIVVSGVGNKLQDGVTLQNLDVYGLRALLAHLNVFEFFAVFFTHKFVNRRSFDQLLPEYLRVEKFRNNTVNNANDCESILMNLYNFYNGKLFSQADTQLRVGVILPKVYELDVLKTETLDSYFCQPKLSGIRISMHKAINGLITMYNKYNVKVLFKLFSFQDPNNSYSGEFMLILKTGDRYENKEELLKYLYTPSREIVYPTKKILLVLLDLFMWNNVNLLINSYEKRQQLFDVFIETVWHDNSILKIDNGRNHYAIYAEYDKYLKSQDLQNLPLVEGIVYRKKHEIFQSTLEFIDFAHHFQKYIQMSKYQTVITVLKKDDLPVFVPETIPICVYQNKPVCKKTENVICYKIEKHRLWLATFKYPQFVHTLTLYHETENYSGYVPHMKNNVAVNGIFYKYIILKLGYDGQDRIISMEFRKEKSLLDCQ